MPESIPFPLAATIGGVMASVIAYQELLRRGHEGERVAKAERDAVQSERTVVALENLVELVKGLRP